MPEVLTMIQISRLTPTPAVLSMVHSCAQFSTFLPSRTEFYESTVFILRGIYSLPRQRQSFHGERNLFQALLSMLYLCSSDIFALINYVGFATWVCSCSFDYITSHPLAHLHCSLYCERIKNNLDIQKTFLQLSIGVSVVCLPWLRWTQPNLPRPIKVNLMFPIVYILATLFVTIVPMYASPVETGRKFVQNKNTILKVIIPFR